MVNERNIDAFTTLNGKHDKKSNAYFREILNCVIAISRKHLNYDRGFIFLADLSREMLFPAASFGFPDSFSSLFERHFFHMDNPEHNIVLIDSFVNGTSYLVNDINNPEISLSPETREYANKLNASSFICCPIIAGSDTLGVISVDNYKQKRNLVPEDINILKSLAFIIGMALSNKGLADSETTDLHDIINALASSIDTRDPLNAGHSQKVTEYALGVCRELGISEGYSEVIQLAATLHDYGKKNVPEHILKKDKELTDWEYDLLKTHAEKTRKGLEKVNFSGKFRLVPKIAGSHHEKCDGSGYPQGLKGNRIPLGARIIAVADYFDAITSNRHYRKPMTTENAFALLRRESKIHLDQTIVEAFIRYYQNEYITQERPPACNDSVECLYN